MIHSDFAADFAVFTGLQMVRPRGKDDPREVRMIKHKSMYYIFNAYNIEFVL
uniref:Uncharacterized protein n=3 Tax=Oryza TaxID=4527 RepID=A0A0D3HHE6_9ORYZ